MNIKEMILAQRDFFKTGATKSYDFRIEQLNRLKNSIVKYESEILKALYDDLRKSKFEAYTSEVALVVDEINFMLKNLKSLMKIKKVKMPLLHQPGSSYIKAEPLGNSLIIGPWNYPFQLLFAPLVGSISAGNTAILKTSEVAPFTSAIMKKILDEIYPSEYVLAIEGGVETATSLLNEKFDYIFFTGSTVVGKIVMKAAAEHLTPLTLELGGKSPCIVDKSVDIRKAARRVVWGKFFNAGQTCIAPDYLLVNGDIKEEFIDLMKEELEKFYGDDPQDSEDYPRIINERHFNRLKSLILKDKVVAGGVTDLSDKYISPTIMDNISWDDEVMKEEIFGPILPILEYNDISEAIDIINAHPKPLALYLFSKDKNVEKNVINNTSSGGVCINDTLSHITTNFLPFGGVGESGMGSYHGKNSFYTFSHQKSVMKKSCVVDPALKYPPYLPLQKIKKLLKML